ncbi:MAG: UDP-N-acetylmuramoyl-L-alanyl-D-glutamate--2,6-diaminopimelate ligase [Rubrivivax sp.]|nr:UDP-N-acetylmuramoyl-L-alanyl-D-glutamate--2,6-diaminopimelate ligase [Rubrivivax sp.]
MPQLHSAAEAARWLRARCPGRLCSDSRQLQPGDAFLAWPGAARDGRVFVPQALAAGAAACLIEAAGAQDLPPLAALGEAQDRVALLTGLKAAAGEVAAVWHGLPTQQLPVLAVTGTNGKTSTAWWLAQALSACGRRAGVVGTLGIGEPPQLLSTGLTTPDPVTLQAAFADFAKRGFAACAIEASSIGIAEERLAGTQIRVALFSNFTQDHLDYHGDMARYWAAKRRLFSWAGLQAVVINVDDPQGARLAAELQSQPGAPALWTVSAQGDARLRAERVRYVDGGLAFELIEAGHRAHLQTALIGEYNVHNLLLVLGGLRALGVPLADAVAAAHGLSPVPGRMQRVGLADDQAAGSAGAQRALPDVVVDYAHTPDALDKALQALRPFARARGGALWCVFGCGGDRDPGKRPLMAAIAAAQADRVVVTSDNPRSESPMAIIDQVLAGVPAAVRAAVPADAVPADAVHADADRRAAIAWAVQRAAAQDVLLIAGKGHEDYQEIAGERLPFSDAEEARKALERRS